MKGLFFVLAVICATLCSSFGQTFDPSNPTLFLVNRSSEVPDASGVVTKTYALETVGANNEAGGNGSSTFYAGASSASTTVDPDPCDHTTTDTKCSASASCVTSPSNPIIYQCICNSGFNDTSTLTVAPSTLVQPGTNCVDIDECLNTTICGVGHDTCNNTDGSYFCTCLTGYSVNSDNFSCNYIDECTALLNPCHTNATCTRTSDGSASCACNDPFVGDGRSNCIEGKYDYSYRAELIAVGITSATQTETEAAVLAILEEYKTADAISSTFAFNTTGTTITQERATPQGANVSIIVSIVLSKFTRSADELTQLMNTIPLTTLYRTGSTALSMRDYDECPTNYGNCSTLNGNYKNETICTNTNGAFTCACASTLYDNSTALGLEAGMKCVDSYSYVCDGTKSTLSLVIPFFTDAGVDVTTLVVNTNCTGVTSGDFYIFTDCNGTDSSTNSTLTSAFNVLTNETALPSFIATKTVNFTYYCNQPTSQNVTLNFSANEDTNFVPVPIDIFSDSSQDVQFNIEKYNEDFTSPAGDAPIKTGDNACIEVSSPGIGTNVEIHAETVWTGAPGFSTSTGGDYLTIIDNFCPVTTNTGINVVINPGGKICFTMHRPRNGYELQVVLKVLLCVEPDCNIPACSKKRRRRNAGNGKKVREQTVTTVFTISRDDLCNKYCGNGVCIYDAEKVNQNCACYDNSFKRADGICEHVIADTDTDSNGSSSFTILITVISVGIVLLIGIAVLTAFLILRRKNAYRRKDYENSYDNTAYKS